MQRPVPDMPQAIKISGTRKRQLSHVVDPRSRPKEKGLGARRSLGKYPKKISQEILVEGWRSVTWTGRKLMKHVLMIKPLL